MATLNAYQQAQLDKLNKLKGMTPEQYAASNGTSGWFDTSKYASMKDWMSINPEYQAAYNENFDTPTAASQAALDKITTKLSDIWNSNNAQQAGLQNQYNNILSQAQSGYDYSLSHPDGGDSWVDNLMAVAIPTIAGAIMTGGALGVFDGIGAAAGGTGAAASAGGSALADAGAASSGLGSIAAGSAVDASIPAVYVTGAAGGGGIGAGTVAAGAAGLGGLGAIANGGSGAPEVDPTIPQVHVTAPQASGITDPTLGSLGLAGAGIGAATSLPVDTSAISQLPDVSSGTQIPESSLPPLVMPTQNPDPAITNSDVVGPDGGVGSVGTTLGSLPGSLGGGSSLPGSTSGLPSLSDIIGGLGTIAGGITDYQMNQADKDYYQGILDKINNAYSAGSPEATLMQQQMDAKDAAAGRNSQYGVRAVNLAGVLNQQKSSLMTSPGYVALAQDARGHYDNSLNGIFSSLGQASTSGTSVNNLVNSIPGLVNNAGSALSKIFGGGS